MKWHRLAAAQGHAGGQFNVGVMYKRGLGVPQDYAEALKWYRLAAEQGLAKAQANVGTMYFDGVGVQQDYAEALKWGRLAAAQGYATAQANLGVMYATGRGVSEDYVLAYMWFDLAANQGFGPSVNYKATLAEEMTPDQIAKAEEMSADWVANYELRQTKYAQSQKEFKTYEGHKQQFLIDIPEGWSAYEQMAVITGPRPTGMVIFSEENIANMENLGQQLDAMARWDIGIMPSFFVDRHPKNKKMSCNYFEKKETKSVTKMLKKDNMFARDRKVITPLTVTPISLGGCKGIRLKGETEKQDGTRWVMDVHAVSDGEILYLFSLRNIKENYEKNLSVYEKAMSTVKFTSVANSSELSLRPTSTKIRNPGTITLPKTFEKVWFRDGAKGFSFKAYSASGRLVINERNIEFRAKKNSFDIPIRNITGIHWGKMRGDSINDWAFLVYEIDGIAKTGGFKDGHNLGHGKDADMIFSTIKYAAKRLSAAGHEIVFSSTRDGNYDIYTTSADGSIPFRLTSNPAHDAFPVWSPDGARIAFISDRDGNTEIYVMNADGSNLTRLTDNPANDGFPDWSPDGTRIAFTSDRDGAPDIYVIDLDGSNLARLTTQPAADMMVAWSPDGTKIAFASMRDGNIEIYVMNVDGSNGTRLTDNPANDVFPDWSPDGARIAFISDRDGNTEIYVMNADGSGLVRLTHDPATDIVPAWSRDGAKIVFHSERDGNYEIYVMNADGTGLVNLTNHPGIDVEADW